MPTTKKKPGEKPGKIRRFLEFLHIKKKPKVYETSPELLRYELDMLLEDIEYYIGRLPDSHSRKTDLQSTVGTLDRLGNKDIKDATQRAQGLFEWVKEEVQSLPKPTVAPVPPSAMQQASPTQAPSPMAKTAAPPPKAKSTAASEGYDQPPERKQKDAARPAPPKASPSDAPEGYDKPPELQQQDAAKASPPKATPSNVPEGYDKPELQLQDSNRPSPPKASPSDTPEGYDKPELSTASASASPPPPPPPQPSSDANNEATIAPQATKEKRRLPAETLKELKVEKPLGEGNFATTYSMKGPNGQVFAVKVPKAKQPGDPNEAPSELHQKYIAEELANTEAEFKREAEFYDRIQQAEGGGHPNIAKCYGYQTVGDGDDAKQGLVMEVIDGKNAQKTMTDLRAKFLKGEISSEEYFGVMQYTLEKMLEAAKFLGEQGVSHRDMKPDNVMIDRETGDVKLVDFGVSEVIGEKPDKGRKIPIGFVPPELNKVVVPTAAEDPFGVGGTAYMWNEQQVLDYQKKEGQGSFENMRNFAADDRRAIEVAPQEQEARDFRRQLEVVTDLYDEWDVSTDYATQQASSIPQDMKDAQKLGAEKKFKEAQEKLQSLAGALRSAVPADSGAAQDKKFAMELKRVERKVTEIDDSLVSAKFIGDPFRLKSLLDSIRPLVAKARQHGDRMEFGPGLAVLAEASARLKESEAPSGQHNAETLFTDFMNQLMHPDPDKRLTPEGALNHPFMKSKLLDEDAARRVLKADLAGPAGQAKPDANAADEKKWEAAEQSIYEAKRRLKAVGACRQEDAARRQTVLNEMQLLAAEAAKAADEARQRKQDATQSTPEVEDKAAKAAAKRWTDFSARNDELKALLDAAQRELDERKAVQTEVGQTGRLVQGLASRNGADISELQGLFKQAMTLSKPGGPLGEARTLLAEIQSKIKEQFGENEKRALLTDGLAHGRTQIDELEKQAASFDYQANRYGSDAKQARDEAEEYFEAALKQAAKQEKHKNDEEKREEAKKLERENRKKSSASRSNEEAYQSGTEDSKELARRRREMADKATKMLAQAERLGEGDVDAALLELDSASELLRVTLAQAAKTASVEVPEGAYKEVSDESEESHEEQPAEEPQSGRQEPEKQATENRNWNFESRRAKKSDVDEGYPDLTGEGSDEEEEVGEKKRPLTDSADESEEDDGYVDTDR